MNSPPGIQTIPGWAGCFVEGVVGGVVGGVGGKAAGCAEVLNILLARLAGMQQDSIEVEGEGGEGRVETGGGLTSADPKMGTTTRSGQESDKPIMDNYSLN